MDRLVVASVWKMSAGTANRVASRATNADGKDASRFAHHAPTAAQAMTGSSSVPICR